MAWNRPKERDQGLGIRDQGAGKSPFRGLVAGAIVVVGAAVAAWWIFGNGDDAAVSSKPPYRDGLIREVKPAAGGGETPCPQEKRGGSGIAASLGAFASATGAGTNALDALDKVALAAKTNTVPQPIFTDPADQAISLRVNMSQIHQMPGMPYDSEKVLERQFEESLKHPIVINPDDSEEVKRMKQNVIDARERIQEMRKDGYSVKEILQEHEKIVNENIEIRQSVVRDLWDYRRKGDMEGARKYLMKMNICLQQMGIPEVEMPMTPRERREKREAERAQELGL